MRLVEAMEEDGVVHAVQELRPEMTAQFAQYLVLHGLAGRGRVLRVQEVLLDDRGADVGSEDHHRVLEVHGAPLTIGEPPVVQHLQQQIEDVVVGLLNFVEEHHRIRPTAHRLAQVPPFFVADVSGRRAHQSGHGVLLHVFGHVDAHHGLIVVEEKLGQGPCQLGLSDAGGAEEDERPDWTTRITQARTSPPHGIGHGLHRFGLPHHAGGQALLHTHQLGAFALQHPLHRNARPRSHHLGDVLLGHFLAEQRGGSPLLGRLLFDR